MNTDTVPSFQVDADDVLRSHGLSGPRVWCTLRDGALELQGEGGALLRLGPAEVARLRVGFIEGRRRHYAAWLWRDGTAEPLVLRPRVETWAGYTRTMRGFAASMAAAGLGDRLERGSSASNAALAPVLFGLLSLGALWVAVALLADAPWWGRLLVPAVPLALFALTLRTGTARHRPRPVHDLAVLDRQLPPLFTGEESVRDRFRMIFG